MTTSRTKAEDFVKELGIETQDKDYIKTLKALEGRFDEVVLKTVLARLSDEEFAQFKLALRSKHPQEEIAAITARVPGLADDIEIRLTDEYRLMQSVLKKV
ncbi:hypothetical protein KW790_02955 [Candidatus Parcubacteria bacterium]|nr:hypothetical protein [Candidatus Parcubacteria bacterium]